MTDWTRGVEHNRKDNLPKILALVSRLMVVRYCWLGMEVGDKKKVSSDKEALRGNIWEVARKEFRKRSGLEIKM